MTRILLTLALATLLLVGLRWAVARRYASAIYSLPEAPSRPVAIVFGAGLRRDGSPTTVLADRVRAAVDLYRRGAVSRILLSGSTGRGDEPSAMRAFALQIGAPESALLLDSGGDRTYSTCARARSVFGVGAALLVTQRYHLPRALVLCNALGVRAIGVEADLHPYSLRSQWIWGLREIPATAVALWEVFVMPGSRPNGTSSPDAEGLSDEP